MSLSEISDLAGWMAAESNHAHIPQKADELGLLCDHFESNCNVYSMRYLKLET